MIDDKQQELFTSWADREFGPSPKLPQIQRYASYWKCWQAVLASQPKPASTDTTRPTLLPGEPDYTCHLFQALAAQLTPAQQGELEVIRIAVIQLRQWGRLQQPLKQCAKDKI